MRQPPSFFRSIGFRIFFIYSLILFAAFALFSSSVYVYFRHEIYRRVDSLIDVKAQGVENALRAYLKTRKLEEPNGWSAFFSGFAPKEDDFPVIADMLTESDKSLQDGMRLYVNIFDAPTGKLLASTSKTPAALSIDPGILKRLPNEKDSLIYSFHLKSLSQAGIEIPARAAVRGVLEKGKPLYIVQARMSLVPVNDELARLARGLFLMVLMTVAVVSWSGFFLVKMTLRPVDKMVRSIRNIRSDNLSVRMPVVDFNDEIRLLGRTFNDMLDRLEKSFEAQRQIVQDLSHELKTPITILRGQLEVALKRPRSVEEYENVLRAGVSEIETIRRIIDDLLMLARLDSRAMTLEMKPVRLDLVIEYLLEDVRALADSKKIAVVCGKSSAITIQANEIHLRRLFMNLLDNAVKYTDKGGRIEIQISEEAGNGVVVIQDNGIGIPAEHLPNIFDRFYRANKAARADGYGLGLGIVKSIVDAHKGRIEVKSAPGQGTAFRVILPKQFPMELFAGQETRESLA